MSKYNNKPKTAPLILFIKEEKTLSQKSTVIALDF